MHRSARHFVLAAAFVSASSLAQSARAGDSGMSLAALVGYSTNDLNVGIGARAGYTLPVLPLYFGGTAVYQMGRSESVPGGTLSAHLSYVGAEGGLAIDVDPLVLRPYVGLGPAFATSTDIDEVRSATHFAFWPGLDVLVPLGPVFVGADVRYLVVSDNSAVGLFATAGVQL
jgi:Outer membrane protein beta-barrel domain